MVGSSGLLVFGHFFLAVLPQIEGDFDPIYRGTFAYVIFGLAYSLYTSAMWACVP